MDIYVITYGSKWGWKYETGIVQKLCNTKDDAIDLAKMNAKQRDGSVYVQQNDGKFKKLKD